MAIGITALFGPDGYREGRGDPGRFSFISANKHCLIIYLKVFVAIKKSPVFLDEALIKDGQRLTLPGVILVPSALAGLTALFGMGRGDPRRYSHLKVLVHGRWSIVDG